MNVEMLGQLGYRSIAPSDPSKMDFGSAGNMVKKAWKDIWGSGQGIGAIKTIEPVSALVDRLEREYREAKAALAA
jgi:nitronate monooxygenase